MSEQSQPEPAHQAMSFRRGFGIFAMAVLLFVISVSLVFAAAAETTAEPSQQFLELRSRILVTEDNITFGDLFENSEDYADIILTTSPKPGRRLALDPAWLARQAAIKGLKWQNHTGVKRILVKRSGRKIHRTELASILSDELMTMGSGEQYQLVVNTGGGQVYVPENALDNPLVENMDLNPATGLFSAELIPYDGAEPIQLRGRAWMMREIPALIRPVAMGEIISGSDVQWIAYRADRLGVSPVLSEENLVGKVARRSLSAGKPLRAHDLKTPDAVSKGDMISISYKLPGLQLTAKGKVLVNAGIGETVRAVNLQSNRTIEVTITGPGQALAVPAQTLGG